jgi:hypothetical protein
MASSDASSVSSCESDVENMILDQPIYYVLNQFLVTEEGKNVATCLDDLTKEIRDHKKVVTAFLKVLQELLQKGRS